MKARTRFAPSPTGFMHVGGVRTALFAWLVARQAGGQFILRIEDTDKAREVDGAEQHIQDSLKALGLDWDEGPIKQSDRLENYKKWAERLVESGRAYADPYSKDELASFRASAQKDKKPFLFRNHRPANPPAWGAGMPLRFKSDPKAYKWNDAVMGNLSAGQEVVDDFILIKSDGYPTYNLAHIVDDTEMKITHVIRGQEFLASMPNYLNLYEALEIERPILATMPPILNEQGNKKLSKRDGAKDVLEYIKDGYLPDALINFIASLGWNDGTTQELFSKQELIKKFNLNQVQRSGARFDERRLLWMNGQYIAKLSDEELVEKGLWPAESDGENDEYKRKIAALIKQRVHTLADVSRLSAMFFEKPDPKAVSELMSSIDIDNSVKKKMLGSAQKELTESSFTEDDIKNRLNAQLAKLNTKPAVLFALIRIAVSGQPYSPELFGSLTVLGKDKTLSRLKTAINALV